jgi:hypothetical protein
VLGRIFTAQPQEGPAFSFAGSKMLQADVLGSLEYEGWKRGGILDAAGPTGLENPPKGLLRNVFRGSPVLQPTKRKEPKPLPKLADQTRFRPFALGLGHRGRFCRDAVPVTLAFYR